MPLSFPPFLFPLFVFLPSLIDSSNIPSSLPSVLVSFTVLSVRRSAHTSLFCLPSFCPYCLNCFLSPVLLFYLSSVFLHSGLPPLPSSLFPSSSLPVFCLPSFLPSVSLYISSSHCLCGRRVTTSVISSCLSSPRRYISSLYVLSPRLQVCSVSDSMKVKIKETCVRLPAVHPLTHLK